MLNRRAFAASIISAPAFIHSQARLGARQQHEFMVDGVTLHEIGTELMPFGAVTNYPIANGEGFDEEGVRLNRRAGEWHNNPVTQSQYGLMMLAGYRASGDGAYLEAAIANASRIHSYTEDHDGRSYFSYGFDMRLFSRDDMVLEAPWYSGMAQGQVLQFFSQLALVTGEDAWSERADRVFASFQDVMNMDIPWAPTIDDLGYLWFEEYPYDPQQHVLNGHVFALAGVYQYWLLTGDEWAATLTKGAIRTILDRKDEFRVEGHQSRYALEQQVQSDTYHEVHMDQLLYLYSVSQDDRFLQTADNFADDSPAHHVVGTLHLAPGEYVTAAAENESTLLVLEADQVMEIAEDTAFQIVQRRAEHETRRIFYKIERGESESLWIEESDNCMLRGIYTGAQSRVGTMRGSIMNFVPARPFTLQAGQYASFADELDDFTGDPTMLDVPEDTTCQVTTRALITAVPYVQVEMEGAGAYWIEWGGHFQHAG